MVEFEYSKETIFFLKGTWFPDTATKLPWTTENFMRNRSTNIWIWSIQQWVQMDPSISCHSMAHMWSLRFHDFSLNFSCDNLNHDNIFTYEILLVIGIVCFITSVLSSALMKKIAPKVLFGEFERWFYRFYSSCNDFIGKFFFNSFVHLPVGVWLTISIIACVTLNIFTEFKWTIISFLLFMCFGSCANIAMAVGINLFPSKFKGMATAFVMMSGRLGSFVGSSVIGLMLADMCSWIFVINGAIMMSK